MSPFVRHVFDVHSTGVVQLAADTFLEAMVVTLSFTWKNHHVDR